VSLTLVPSLARQFLKVESIEATENETIKHRIYRTSERALRRLENGYRRALHFSMRRSFAVIVGSMVVLAAVLPVYNMLGFEYMPESDEGEVRVFGTMAPGTRLDALDTAFTDVERIVREVGREDISSIYTQFGQPEWFRGGGNSRGSLNVQLVPAVERTRSSQLIAEELNERLSAVPGVRLFTRATGGLFVFRMVSPEADSISIEVRGYDRDRAAEVAQRIADMLGTIPGISDTRVDRDDGRPEVSLEIDRYRAAEAGLTVTDIAENVRTNFGGQIATRYREGGDEFDVRVRLKESDRHALSDLREHWVIARSGERVPASNFLTESRVVGPTEIERRNQERVIEVRADLDPEYTLGDIMPRVERELAEIDVPDDFSIYHGGEYEEQQKSYRELMLGLVLAVLLVYMVMAAQFESFVHPFIIMFSIPFASIGVIGALYITDTPVSVQSILGIIMLAGIVVNNAIVLVDYINMLRREKGLALEEAIEEGGRRRLRPILMTTLTTVLALVPMAFGVGSGGEMQAPMARVVIGGMLTSTLITLIFVPVLYAVVARTLEKSPAKPA
jgi:HAE1 family hydrophobic/amphiphilic exporter-1